MIDPARINEWTPRSVHEMGCWDDRDALHWLAHGIRSHAKSTNKCAWSDIYACAQCRRLYEMFRSLVAEEHR